MSTPPLKPGPLHVLLALAHQDLHGYALLRTVHEQSGGRVSLRTGSLYRHLAALIDAGLVTQLDNAAEDDARRSVYYRLTSRGRAMLAEQRTYLSELTGLLDALALPRPRSRA